MTKLQQIANRIRELEREDDGLVLEERVLADAINPDSVLHDQYNWNDAEAAHEQRLEVTRRLIRRIKYVETVERIAYRAPRYVMVTLPSREKGYMSLDRVRASEDRARDVLADEITRIRAACGRARAVADVLGLRGELEAVLASLIALQERMAAA